eukprot:3771098-Amphidinium_carterae.1
MQATHECPKSLLTLESACVTCNCEMRNTLPLGLKTHMVGIGLLDIGLRQLYQTTVTRPYVCILSAYPTPIAFFLHDTVTVLDEC